MIDLTGQRFGRLIAKTYLKNEKKWHCICDCGKTNGVRSDHLRQKKIQSCGCLLKEANTKHGMAESPEYVIWCAIIQRCFNKNNRKYSLYGSRGITMSESWRNSFLDFYADMGPKPGPQYSIDRINVNGNYEAGNCRWATNKEQCLNTRRNIRVTHVGKSLTVDEWSSKTGIHRNTITHRLNRGLPSELVLSKRKLSWGEALGRPKLDIDAALKIRTDKRSQREIALDYKVSQATIYRIKSGKSWAKI